jgi:hypothetical protein
MKPNLQHTRIPTTRPVRICSPEDPPVGAPPEAGMTSGPKIARVFPRITKATPRDAMAFFGAPDLFAEADEVHVSVTFTADKSRAERLAEAWHHVAPVKLGGIAYGDSGRGAFTPGLYIKRGYTFTSRGSLAAAGSVRSGNADRRLFRYGHSNRAGIS